MKHELEIQGAGGKAAGLAVWPCDADPHVWNPNPMLDGEDASDERVAAVQAPWAEELTCDALLQLSRDGGVIVAEEVDGGPAAGSWRCDEAAEFRVVFGPATNPERGVGVRLRCRACAEGAVAAFGMEQAQLLPL